MLLIHPMNFLSFLPKSWVVPCQCRKGLETCYSIDVRKIQVRFNSNHAYWSDGSSVSLWLPEISLALCLNNNRKKKKKWLELFNRSAVFGRGT